MCASCSATLQHATHASLASAPGAGTGCPQERSSQQQPHSSWCADMLCCNQDDPIEQNTHAPAPLAWAPCPLPTRHINPASGMKPPTGRTESTSPNPPASAPGSPGSCAYRIPNASIQTTQTHNLLWTEKDTPAPAPGSPGSCSRCCGAACAAARRRCPAARRCPPPPPHPPAHRR